MSPSALVAQATGPGAVTQDLNFADRAVAPLDLRNLTVVEPPVSAPPAVLIDKACRVMAWRWSRLTDTIDYGKAGEQDRQQNGFSASWGTACHGAVCYQIRQAQCGVAPSFLSVRAHRVCPGMAPESMLVPEVKGVPARRCSGHSWLTGTAGSWAVRKDLGLAFWAVSPPGLSVSTNVMVPKPACVSKLVSKVKTVLTRIHCSRGCFCCVFIIVVFIVISFH